jgi:hypothetical protein
MILRRPSAAACRPKSACTGFMWNQRQTCDRTSARGAWRHSWPDVQEQRSQEQRSERRRSADATQDQELQDQPRTAPLCAARPLHHLLDQVCREHGLLCVRVRVHGLPLRRVRLHRRRGRRPLHPLRPALLRHRPPGRAAHRRTRPAHVAPPRHHPQLPRPARLGAHRRQKGGIHVLVRAAAAGGGLRDAGTPWPSATPRHTAPHRTAPHRTAPHRTAPHRHPHADS